MSISKDPEEILHMINKWVKNKSDEDYTKFRIFFLLFLRYYEDSKLRMTIRNIVNSGRNFHDIFLTIWKIISVSDRKTISEILSDNDMFIISINLSRIAVTNFYDIYNNTILVIAEDIGLETYYIPEEEKLVICLN